MLIDDATGLKYTVAVPICKDGIVTSGEACDEGPDMADAD